MLAQVNVRKLLKEGGLPAGSELPAPLLPGTLNGATEEFKTPSLVFESRFECGNLRAAVRTGETEYDLIVDDDTNTRGNNQWYCFSVTCNAAASYSHGVFE